MTSRDDPGMETPVAPLPEVEAEPAPRSRLRRRKDRASAPPGGLKRSLGAGLAYVRGAWRVLLVVLLVQLVLALSVVLPFWSGIAPYLDHHAHAPALAGSPDEYDTALGWEAGLDPGIWRDILREEASLFSGLTLAHFWVAVVAWLFGALAAGGFLGTAASGERPVVVGHFMTLGGKHFGRMLRVGIVFALAYYLAARVVFEMWALSVESDERMASSEGVAWWGARLREGIFVLLFLWFRLAADMARAELVVFSRRSALGAFVRALWRSLRPRPILVALGFGVPAFALLLLLSFAAHGLAGDGWVVLLALFLVFQVAVLVRWASRAGVLCAFAHLVGKRA